MKVVVVAHTMVEFDGLKEVGYIPQWEANQDSEPNFFLDRGYDHSSSDERFWQIVDINPEWEQWKQTHIPTEIDELAEAGGRLCYLSFNRPNEKTASNKGYLANIIQQQHFSVLEHGSVTFYVEGVSRSMLLELERHRHLSFSVVSQRYVNHSESEFVSPPIVDRGSWEYADMDKHHKDALQLYQEIAEELISQGATRKEAYGAARAVLPEGTETKFFVTGNIRTWREIIQKRNTDAADQEIREFAQRVLGILQEAAPNSVQDLGGVDADVVE